jgi:hypothetical protein
MAKRTKKTSEPPTPFLLPALASTPPPETPALPDSDLAALRRELQAKAIRSIEILGNLQELADKDAVRVTAANSILDRIGLVRPREQPAGNDIPAGILATAIAGMAKIAEIKVSAEALERLREIQHEAPRARNVTPNVSDSDSDSSSQKGEP